MDHDAHVKAYHRHQIGKAVAYAVALSFGMRLHGMRPRRKRWTWKNHLANWINKTVNLLEKWGL